MSLTVQVNSVNRKVLDLTTVLPPGWDDLEAEVRDAVREVAARGKVHVRIELVGDAASRADWDEIAVVAGLTRLRELAEAQSIPFHPTPELLWQVANAQRLEPPPLADEAAKDIVRSALAEALRAFTAMRAKEGAALLVDFLGRLAVITRLVEAVAVRAPAVAPAYREQLLKRLADGGLELNLDDERVLKEIAFFAERCDVTEEITRLRSHLEQFSALLRSVGEIGRKAEFILQEIGREVNTIGSKANDLEIARHVIELKNELDRVREQIANVE